MVTYAKIHANADSLVVSGELNFATVVSLWRDSLALLVSQTHLNFDLSGVTLSNSAGMALILEWIKYAKNHSKMIRFENIPAQLVSIISVSGLQSILHS